MQKIPTILRNTIEFTKKTVRILRNARKYNRILITKNITKNKHQNNTETLRVPEIQKTILKILKIPKQY